MQPGNNQPLQPTPQPPSPPGAGLNVGQQIPDLTSNPQPQHIQNPQPESQKPNNSGPGPLGQIKTFLSFAFFIGGVVLAAFLINQFVFQSYFVEGTSMVPTLQNNDRLIIEKVGKTTSQLQGKPYIPNRGDIVVLDGNVVRANGTQEQLIKRVIGLPGEIVMVENGVVKVINQQEPSGFNVDQRLGLDLEPTYSSEPLTFSVPEGHVFVMGDNRTQNGSHDSRAFGAISASSLEGRLWARILPVDQAQIFSLQSRLLPI